ncbi:MAG: hypothetical protein GVY19_06795 [Bacteroidetes bacterium]|nr:hypothetical protein [Bacteroidota bacterium]
MKITNWVLVFAYVWFTCHFTSHLMAQTCCSGGVPLGGSLGPGTADGKTMQVLLTYDYNRLDDLVNETEILNDRHRTRTTQSALLEINYGISNRISVAGVIPYIRQTRSVETFQGNTNFTDVNGLGDMLLLLKYRILNPNKHPTTSWVVGAGPKFPTGQTDHTSEQGFTLAADMQPGSGSWDAILWSYFQKDNIAWPNLGLSSVVTYRHSGTNNTYNETQRFQFGNEIQYNLGVMYNIFLGWPVNLFVYGRYRYQSQDYLDGSVFPQTGGQWIYTLPGMSMPFLTNGSVRISAAIPLYRKLNGTQLTTGYQIKAAVSYTFPLIKEEITVNENITL